MLSEELRILTDRLESTEQNARQTQLELEKIEIQKESSKLKETKSLDLPSASTKATIASSSLVPATAVESSSSTFHVGKTYPQLLAVY